MMIETAKKLALLPVSGVKIHQLMIIKGTELENRYNKGLVSPLTLQEYTEILCDFLSVLRPNQHIHRLMADSRTEFGLIAPLWSEHKLQSLSEINSYMERENVRQGDCCSAVSSDEEKSELVDIKTTDWYKKMDSEMKPGDYLKTYRNAHSLTQSQLSEMIGVSVPYLSDMETGKRAISRKKAKELAEIFKCSPGVFI
ncbi:MAG: helix-turn-helix domain-containing protein [Fibrobacter sp.]|nr:helix-turn-helix domain-containing protein [Fibrobacter sp.]